MAFAQDKWHLRNLTINAGIRYDVEVTRLNNQFNPLFQPGKYAVDKNNFAPRVGLAWKPGGSERSLVRGGYGIFYDKIVLQTLTQFVTNGVYSSSFVAAFPADRADPGPGRGQLPTDPMLVNGPVVNRALVNGLFPPGTRTAPESLAISKRMAARSACAPCSTPPPWKIPTVCGHFIGERVFDMDGRLSRRNRRRLQARVRWLVPCGAPWRRATSPGFEPR